MNRGGWSWKRQDRKSTRLNSSHTVIYTLSLHDALPIWTMVGLTPSRRSPVPHARSRRDNCSDEPRWVELETPRSEEHTSELQSHRDLHSFPTRRSSDLDHGRSDSLAPLAGSARSIAAR